MYKKAISFVFVMNCLGILSIFCVKGQCKMEMLTQKTGQMMLLTAFASEVEAKDENIIKETLKIKDIMQENVMKENVVQENVVQENVVQEDAMQEDVIQEDAMQENVIQEDKIPEKVIQEETVQEEIQQEDAIVLEQAQMDVLLRIVEAEAGCEDEEGKLLVANVVMNRVRNEDFPDTVKEVVYQKADGVTQFSPVGNGKINHVVVSEETRLAVERALMGEDISKGALYFAARKYADSEKMKWFDDNLEFLFQHGGHEFFK